MIQNKYPGTCSHCRYSVKAGEGILARDAQGAMLLHVHCEQAMKDEIRRNKFTRESHEQTT